VWLGVGGSPGSAIRAGRLGLPMVLGLIGGTFQHAEPIVDLYRQAAQQAGHPADRMRLGLTSHFHVGDTSQGSREAFYPYYREYLRPKTEGGRGWLVGPDDFRRIVGASGALMVGSPQEVIDKILAEHELLGTDRFFGQIDLGGLPPELVSHSIELFATEVAPVIRKETRTEGTELPRGAERSPHSVECSHDRDRLGQWHEGRFCESRAQAADDFGSLIGVAMPLKGDRAGLRQTARCHLILRAISAALTRPSG
jgi:hypothetical protein